MKIELYQVTGLAFAMRAMRRSYKHPEKSDSLDCLKADQEKRLKYFRPNLKTSFSNADIEADPTGKKLTKAKEDYEEALSEIEETGCLPECPNFHNCQFAIIGPKDRGLCKLLTKNGSSERKNIRFIQVYMTITAPLYWWSEFDTYRVGVEKDSESTMHTLMRDPISLEDFSSDSMGFKLLNLDLLPTLEKLRKQGHFDALSSLLPRGYLQTRDVMASYEALRNIYHQRKGHKLREWAQFRAFCETLPYSEFITAKEGPND